MKKLKLGMRSQNWVKAVFDPSGSIIYCKIAISKKEAKSYINNCNMVSTAMTVRQDPGKIVADNPDPPRHGKKERSRAEEFIF
jgi:hypothetical protein